jgi:hypothetical protein
VHHTSTTTAPHTQRCARRTDSEPLQAPRSSPQHGHSQRSYPDSRASTGCPSRGRSTRIRRMRWLPVEGRFLVREGRRESGTVGVRTDQPAGDIRGVLHGSNRVIRRATSTKMVVCARVAIAGRDNVPVVPQQGWREEARGSCASRPRARKRAPRGRPQSCKSLSLWKPAVGIEPTTARLQIECSTTELRRRTRKIATGRRAVQRVFYPARAWRLPGNSRSASGANRPVVGAGRRGQIAKKEY